MWDIRQDKRYANYMARIGWKVDMIGSVYCYSKKLPLVDLSVTKIQRPQKMITMEDIENIVRKRKSISVVVEPTSSKQRRYLLDNGFKTSRSVSLPSKTQRIELKKSNNKLLKEMHSKTRYNIKRSSRSKYVLKFSRDIQSFVQLWQKMAYERGMFISQEREILSLYNEFTNSSKILLLQIDGKVEAGVLHLRSRNTCYYMHAFSTQKGKRLYAPTILAWNSLVTAKKSGCTYYDFEGIYDKRAPLPSWKGFSRFKKSFGGASIKHPLPVKRSYVMRRVVDILTQ